MTVVSTVILRFRFVALNVTSGEIQRRGRNRADAKGWHRGCSKDRQRHARPPPGRLTKTTKAPYTTDGRQRLPPGSPCTPRRWDVRAQRGRAAPGPKLPACAPRLPSGLSRGGLKNNTDYPHVGSPYHQVIAFELQAVEVERLQARSRLAHVDSALATAAASFSYVSNTEFSRVMTNTSCSFFDRQHSLSAPPLLGAPCAPTQDPTRPTNRSRSRPPG